MVIVNWIILVLILGFLLFRFGSLGMVFSVVFSMECIFCLWVLDIGKILFRLSLKNLISCSFCVMFLVLLVISIVGLFRWCRYWVILWFCVLMLVCVFIIKIIIFDLVIVCWVCLVILW